MQLDKFKKIVDKLSHNIENKVSDDKIHELEDKIKLLADKENLEKLEQSV